MHDVGSRAVLHGGLSAGAKVPAHGSVSATVSARRGPHALQAALAGPTPCFCYLCTMSLISFTELRSLLKSCVAAGPPPAVAGQI